MKRWKIAAEVSMFAAALIATPVGRADHGHVLINPEDVKWVDAPPILPPGAKIAVQRGNPAEKDLVTVRLKLPANYKVPAHSHPTDEHVLVLSGTLYMGLGDKLDPEAGKPVKPGGFMVAPAKVNHFAYTKEETVIVVYANGPIDFTYVNPDEDPRKKK
nr:cupin domain-containing protein [Gemmataceae bacterium]